MAPALTTAALSPLVPSLSVSWNPERGGMSHPGCPASSFHTGNSAVASLCCERTGSMEGPALRVRHLWGSGCIFCGLGFLGSRQNSTGQDKCYKSHIVWPSSDWGGGLLGHWGLKLQPRPKPSRQFPLDSAAWACLEHTLLPSSAIGWRAGQTGERGLGRRYWRREKLNKGRKKAWKSGGGREAKRDRDSSQT